MVDLDTKGRQECKHLELDGELEVVRIAEKVGQTTRINKGLPSSMKEKLLSLLKRNANLFTWIAADMPRIDLEFMCHRLAVFLKAQVVAQKRRKMCTERAFARQEQVENLLKAGFIR